MTSHDYRHPSSSPSLMAVHVAALAAALLALALSMAQVEPQLDGVHGPPPRPEPGLVSVTELAVLSHVSAVAEG